MKGKLTPNKKWAKMMAKIVKDRTNKNRKISVNIKGKMTIEKFAEKIAEIVYFSDDKDEYDINTEWFVALLESKFANGDIMIQLANHFNYHVNEFKKDEPEWKKYTPKIGVPKNLLGDIDNI